MNITMVEVSERDLRKAGVDGQIGVGDVFELCEIPACAVITEVVYDPKEEAYRVVYSEQLEIEKYTVDMIVAQHRAENGTNGM